MTNIQSICVFCGASLGNRADFGEAAHQLGMELALHGITLVYGGGSTGMMGMIADSTLKHGGQAVGIIPRALSDREVQHNGLTELHIVDSMHERKALMAERSDAFVALPGGFGTYEELFEVITWAQLGIHHKPILVLNVDGYFNPLFRLIEEGVESGFIRQLDPALIRSTASVQEVIPLLQTLPDETIVRPKWMNLDQT